MCCINTKFDFLAKIKVSLKWQNATRFLSRKQHVDFFFQSRGPVFKGAFNANTEDIGVTRNFNSTPEARSA